MPPSPHLPTQVSKVDPLQVHNNFAGMLARPLLAMRVSAALYLHPALRFRARDAEDLVREYADGAGGASSNAGANGAHGSKVRVRGGRGHLPALYRPLHTSPHPNAVRCSWRGRSGT